MAGKMKIFLKVFSFDLASKILIGIVGILLIRYMPVKEYASFTLIISFATFISQAINQTFNRLYILSDQNSKKQCSLSFLMFQIIFLLLIFLFGILFYKKQSYQSYLIALSLIITGCFFDFSKTFYQKKLQFNIFSFIEVFRSFLYVIFSGYILYFFRNSVTANSIIMTQSASYFLVAFGALFKHLKKCKSKLVDDFKFYIHEMVSSHQLYLLAYFFIISIFAQADVFMLKILVGDFELATYGSAFRYYGILSLGLSTIHSVIFPMIKSSTNSKKLNEVFNTHSKLMIPFALLSLIFALLGHFIIPFIDHGRYYNASSVFSILCASAIVSFICSPHVNFLMVHKRFFFLFSLSCFCLLAHIIMCLFFIPIYGAIGAAIATFFASAMVNVSIYVLSRKILLEFNLPR